MTSLSSVGYYAMKPAAYNNNNNNYNIYMAPYPTPFIHKTKLMHSHLYGTTSVNPTLIRSTTIHICIEQQQQQQQKPNNPTTCTTQ